MSIMNTVFVKFKDLFQCPEDGKVDLQAEKAMFVVTQGEGPSFVVNVKLTSPAFDSPVSEDELVAEFVDKVISCFAMVTVVMVTVVSCQFQLPVL